MKAYLYIFIIILSSCNENIDKNKIPIKYDHLEIANRFYDKDDFYSAIENYSLVIEVDSTNGEAYCKRAFCFSMLKEYNQSNIDFLKSVSLGYDVAISLYNIGRNYHIIENDSLALIYYKESYKLDSNNIYAKKYIRILEQK